MCASGHAAFLVVRCVRRRWLGSQMRNVIHAVDLKFPLMREQAFGSRVGIAVRASATARLHSFTCPAGRIIY